MLITEGASLALLRGVHQLVQGRLENIREGAKEYPERGAEAIEIICNDTNFITLSLSVIYRIFFRQKLGTPIIRMVLCVSARRQTINAVVKHGAQVNGDKLKASGELGIGRTTLYRKLQEYGLLSKPGNDLVGGDASDD